MSEQQQDSNGHNHQQNGGPTEVNCVDVDQDESNLQLMDQLQQVAEGEAFLQDEEHSQAGSVLDILTMEGEPEFELGGSRRRERLSLQRQVDEASTADDDHVLKEAVVEEDEDLFGLHDDGDSERVEVAHNGGADDIVDVDDFADDSVGVPAEFTQGATQAQRKLKRGRVKVMTHYEVHDTFTRHWEDQLRSEEFFYSLKEADFDGDEAIVNRYRTLINVSNWGGNQEDDIRLPQGLVPAADIPWSEAHNPTAATAGNNSGSGHRTLKHHQLEGIRFMWRNLVNGPVEEVPAVGCILAHSMGLGKSCQVIVFLMLFWKHVMQGRVMLVLPKTTIVSWEAEIQRWAAFFPEVKAHLKITFFDDKMSTPERARLTRKWFDDGGVIVIGYESLVALQKYMKQHQPIDQEDLFSSTNPVDLLICDEAHRIKGADRDQVKALMKLHADRRLLLTGTPMQNHLLEYWAMVEFTVPRYFERRNFQQFFIKPITQAMTHNAHQQDVSIAKKKTYTLIRELEYIVQRRDNQLLRKELPPISELVITVALSPVQLRLYEEFLAELRRLTESKAFNLLQAFSYAGKICSHPELLYASSTSNTEGGRKFAKLCQRPEGYTPKTEDSMKLSLAAEIILHAKAAGEKTLVFSISTQLLDFFEQVMAKVGAEKHGSSKHIKHTRIDGSMNSTERTEKVNNFQKPGSNVDVFLLSTKAGGVGITLTAATRVILLDCCWNPADERQAIHRAYRYGQTKPVFVYRLVCSNTIEHRVYDQKMAKDWLFSTVVDDKQMKRDTLVGTKLHEIFFMTDSSKMRTRIKAATEPCLAIDPLLKNVRDKFENVAPHDSLLEEDPANYGDEELGYYNKYKKSGGLWNAKVGEGDTVQGGQRDTHVVEEQQKMLTAVLDRILQRRRDAAEQGDTSLQPRDLPSRHTNPSVTGVSGGSAFLNASRQAPRPAVVETIDVDENSMGGHEVVAHFPPATFGGGGPAPPQRPTNGGRTQAVSHLSRPARNPPPRPPAKGSSADDAFVIDSDDD